MPIEPIRYLPSNVPMEQRVTSGVSPIAETRRKITSKTDARLPSYEAPFNTQSLVNMSEEQSVNLRLHPLSYAELGKDYPRFGKLVRDTDNVVKSRVQNSLSFSRRRAQARELASPLIIIADRNLLTVKGKQLRDETSAQEHSALAFYKQTEHTILVIKQSISRFIGQNETDAKALLAEELLHAYTTFVEKGTIRTGFDRNILDFDLPPAFKIPANPTNIAELISFIGPDEIKEQFIGSIDATIFENESMRYLTENMSHLAIHYMLDKLTPGLKGNYQKIGIISGTDKQELEVFDKSDISLEDLVDPLIAGDVNTIMNPVLKHFMTIFQSPNVGSMVSLSEYAMEELTIAGGGSLDPLEKLGNEDVFFYPHVTLIP